MIGRLGAAEIAAVGIGNQLFFLYMLILFGVGSASGIFVSQFWGKKDYGNIRHTSGLEHGARTDCRPPVLGPLFSDP